MQSCRRYNTSRVRLLSLHDKYIWGATNLPAYTTSIAIDRKTKRIVDYAGEQVVMPEAVSKLEMRPIAFPEQSAGPRGTARQFLH